MFLNTGCRLGRRTAVLFDSIAVLCYSIGMTASEATTLARRIEADTEAGQFAAWLRDVVYDGDERTDHTLQVRDRSTGFLFAIGSPEDWERVRKGRIAC